MDPCVLLIVDQCRWSSLVHTAAKQKCPYPIPVRCYDYNFYAYSFTLLKTSVERILIGFLVEMVAQCSMTLHRYRMQKCRDQW